MGFNRKVAERELTRSPTSGAVIRESRFDIRLETPKMNMLVRAFYPSTPVAIRFVEDHTFEARACSLQLSTIRAVCCVVGCPKVGSSIIETVTVDVIDLNLRVGNTKDETVKSLTTSFRSRQRSLTVHRVVAFLSLPFEPHHTVEVFIVNESKITLRQRNLLHGIIVPFSTGEG